MPQKSKRTLNPKIAEAIKGATTFAEKLVLVLVSRDMSDDDIDEAINLIDPTGPNLSLPAGETGMQLSHFLGKSPEEIRRECDASGHPDDADGIISDLENAGYDFTEKPKPEPEEETRAPVKLRNESMEPVFGDDDYPLSELAGKSDDELLAIKGIGRATVNKIREAEAERAAKSS